MQNSEMLHYPGSGNRAVVLFHGYGADMRDLAPLKDWLDPAGAWHWYFPNGPGRVDLGAHYEGRSWFPIDMVALEAAMRAGTTRDFAGHAAPGFDAAVAGAEHLCQQLAQRHSGGLVIGGFSQGAMLTSHVALRGQVPLRGLVLLSGNLVDRRALENLRPNPVPVFQSHGQDDEVLGIRGAEALRDLLCEKNFPVTWCPFSGGHEIPPPALHGTRSFLEGLK